MFVPSTRKMKRKITTVWTLDVPGTKVEKVRNECKVKDFFKRSSCPAVTHLSDESQPIAVKITWKTTLIVGVILTAVTTYYSTMSFMNFSGSSEMLLQSNSVSRMEHPKYHICTSSTFNHTILAEMGFVDAEMISYLKLMMSLFVVSPLLLQDVEHQRQLESKFNKILADNRINNLSEIIQRAIFKCEDIIAGCIAPGVFVNGTDCCARFFPSGSFPSTRGACVSTIYSPPFYQTIPSMYFGFVVLVRDLDGSLYSLDNTIVNPIVANQKGVSFSISDKLTDPRVALFKQKYYARIGLWTSLAISKTTVNDEEVISSYLVRKPCANQHEPDRYQHLVPGFDNYTEANCKYAIRQRLVNDVNKCYMVSLPYKGDLPACHPHQLIQLGKKLMVNQMEFKDPASGTNSECVGQCWKQMFSLYASHSDIQLASNFKFGDWTLLQNESKHLAVLNFYYPSFTQTMLVNHYPTICQWLGVLGGNLGLFLGASMVTLIELIVFFTTYHRVTPRLT